MQSFRFRALVLLYRLLGSTPTQAEWRARRALQAPERVKSDVETHLERAADHRFTCFACGQLLTLEDRTCHACGARQWVPPGLRRVARLLGLSKVGPQAGTTLAIITLLAGFLVQLRFFGSDAFTRGLSSDDELAFLSLGISVPELVRSHQPWRAFTYTLFHGGILHLVFNAFALVQIGPAVERWFGFGRFWFGWVLTGIAGVALPLALGRESVVLGASGAVTGLVGMAMVFGHRQGSAQGIALRNGMIKWMIYITLFGLMMGGVAHDAHFAGFAAGAALAWLLPPVAWRKSHRRLTPVITVLGLVLAAVPTGQFAAFMLRPEAERVEQLFPAASRPPLVALRRQTLQDERAYEAWLPGYRATLFALPRRLWRPYFLAGKRQLPPAYAERLEQDLVSRRDPRDLPR